MSFSVASAGVEVSQETLLSLLQLVSFYNCKEATVDDLSEVQYFRQEPRDHIRTWVKDNLAEQLFEMIEEKNAIAYGALIQGMAKVNSNVLSPVIGLVLMSTSPLESL